MWEAITYVSSGVTLVAFIVAAAAATYSKATSKKERLIKLADERERADLVSGALEFFQIDTPNLTREQQFELALEQINARARRFKIWAVSVCFIAVVTGALSAYAINRIPNDNGNGPTDIAYDFRGRWVNKNPEAGVTRAEIQQRLDQLVVHMWGKCHPTDCDWGTETTDAPSAGDVSIDLVWNSEISIKRQKLRILDDGRLEVLSDTEFTDNSGRPSYKSADYLESR